MKALLLFASLCALLFLSGCTGYDANGTVCWITPPEHDWRVHVAGRNYGIVAIAPNKPYGIEGGTYLWCGRRYYWLPIPFTGLLALVGAVGAVAVCGCVIWRRRHRHENAA